MHQLAVYFFLPRDSFGFAHSLECCWKTFFFFFLQPKVKSVESESDFFLYVHQKEAKKKEKGEKEESDQGVRSNLLQKNFLRHHFTANSCRFIRSAGGFVVNQPSVIVAVNSDCQEILDSPPRSLARKK